MLFLSGVLLFAIVVGIGMFAAGLALLEDRETVYSDLAKSGLQLLVVGVLGTAIAAGWKWIEFRRDVERREIEQRRDAYRREAERSRDIERRDYEYERERRHIRREMQLALFVRLVNSYNDVKAIRRTLRSHGLANPSGTLSQRQIDGFRVEMTRLNRVQLDFEALKREIGEARLYDDNSVEILESLHVIESHLNRALSVWERNGAEIDVGTDASVVAVGLDGLIGESAKFKTGVVAPRRRATELMQASLFEGSSETDRTRLKELEDEIDADDT
jgi:hypothetical protein